MIGIVVGIVALVAALVWLAGTTARGDGSVRPLRIYAAAGLRRALEPAAAQYEAETGQPLELTWGGTGALYGQLKAGAPGDLFLAADEITIDRGLADAVLSSPRPVAVQTPTFAVASGNPKAIRSLDDLLREDVAFSLADPDQAATGRAARSALESIGRWEAVRPRVKVFKPTVNDSAADVQAGSADVAVVWDQMTDAVGGAGGGGAWEGLQAVYLPEVMLRPEHVTAATVAGTSNAPAAAAFARWLASPTGGQPHFRAAGFAIP